MLVLWLVGAILVAGCNNSSAGFKTFTMGKGVGHFSFEYAAKYEIGRIESAGEGNDASTDVNFGWWPSSEEAKTITPTFGHILVGHPSALIPNSSADLEFWLSLAGC